jgi:hypothetical protein
MIHVTGIDSPGMAGSPASIALEMVHLLQQEGLKTLPNNKFNPNRNPIIVPKRVCENSKLVLLARMIRMGWMKPKWLPMSFASVKR